MRLLAFLSMIAFGSAAMAQLTPAPPRSDRKIQLAILFDTSNSMDGLIDQAKSRIWSIVNETSALRHNGQIPTLEIALYEYGNDGLSASSNYIRQVLNLTTDLEDVSERLFGLRTNGGSEYCGAVIDASLEALAWSSDPRDLKMIYIAGNEAFTQGPIDFQKACTKASLKNVIVSTIFCGTHSQGIELQWQQGALCSGGNYFNIDSNKEVVHVDTPYDADIRSYNDSLNTTYYGYGSEGIVKKSMQASNDAKAAGEAQSVAAERAIVKSKGRVYKNDNWDLVDADEAGKRVEEMKEEELPDEFKNKTAEEKRALLESAKADRSRFQEKIQELAAKRQEFIEQELKNRSAETNEDDFGTSVNKSILEKANAIGFERIEE